MECRKTLGAAVLLVPTLKLRDMFAKDDLVWAKSSAARQVFWPAKVIESHSELTYMKKKPVIACVEFLVEQTYEAIMDTRKLLPFNCKQKPMFLRKGRGLKDPFKRLQFDSAVKHAEEQIKDLKTRKGLQMPFVKCNAKNRKTKRQIAFMSEGQVNGLNAQVSRKKGLPEKITGQDAGASDDCNCESEITRKGAKRVCPEDADRNKCSKRVKDSRKLLKKNDLGNSESHPCRKKKASRSNRAPKLSCGHIALNYDKNLCNSNIKHDLMVAENSDDSNYSTTLPSTSSNRMNGFSAEDKLGLQSVQKETACIVKEKSSETSTCEVKLQKLDYNELENCSERSDLKDTSKEDSTSSFEQNLVGDDDVRLKTAKDCSISDDEDELSLPEAFSPSPEWVRFRQGDVVWAKYKRSAYWPSQIRRVSGKKNPTHYYVCFLPKKDRKCIKVRKGNIVSFTREPGTYERFKNQEVGPAVRDEFDLALKEAEDILVRRVSPRDKSFLDDDENLSSNATIHSDEDLSLLLGEPDETSGKKRHKECSGIATGDEAAECTDLQTPEKEEQVCRRKRRTVSKYKEILLEFHRCQKKLVNIFQGKEHSDRHQKFHFGTTSEKDQLKYQSGLGPIQDEETGGKILEILHAWFCEVKQRSIIRIAYIYDVWLPEAIIFCIQNTENVSREVAEDIYLDSAKHTSPEEFEKVFLSFKRCKLDDDARQETLDRAKRAFERNAEC